LAAALLGVWTAHAMFAQPLLQRLLAAMLDDPIRVNRPIVVTANGARLCRPSELVFGLLEHRPAAFTKEDGEIVIPRPG
jgi:arsenate reductase